MNYILHNYTNGYSEPEKTTAREIILNALKSYGIFQHLRDISIERLDINSVDNWLIPTKMYEEDIFDLKLKIKDIQGEILNLDDEKIKTEWQKEISRLEWYNNPKSNYYTKKIDDISSTLNSFEPQIEKFNSICNIKWVKDITNDLLKTAKKDLDEAVIEEKKESIKRSENPYKIPTFEEFKLRYIEDKKHWINEFKAQIKSKKECIKRCNCNNEAIKNIFLSLDLMEK